MASPNISRAVKAAAGGHRAGRIAELSEQVRRAAPPPPPVPPTSAPAVARQSAPLPSEEDRRVGQYVKRSAALVNPPEGHTRLFRVGGLATEHPPVSMNDIVTDLWGNKMTRRQLEAQKGSAHSQPAEAMGRWFTDAPQELDFYIKENPASPIYHVDVPNDSLSDLNVSQSKFSSHSRNHAREFVLPDDQLTRATRLLEGLRKE